MSTNQDSLRDMYRANESWGDNDDAHYAYLDEVRQAEYVAQQADPLRATCFCDYVLLTCDEETGICF